MDTSLRWHDEEEAEEEAEVANRCHSCEGMTKRWQEANKSASPRIYRNLTQMGERTMLPPVLPTTFLNA